MDKAERLSECCAKVAQAQSVFQQQTQFYIWDLEEKIRDIKGLPLRGSSHSGARAHLVLMPQPVQAESGVFEAAQVFGRAVWEAISVLEGAALVSETDEEHRERHAEFIRLSQQAQDTFDQAAKEAKAAHAYWHEYILPYLTPHRMECCEETDS